MNNAPIFDLQKAIRDRQEREALKKALAFTRQASEAFRAPLGVMVGYAALQGRICTAIEAGADEYTDGLSIAGALLSMAAGIMGFAAGSLPDGYPMDGPTYWNEAGKRSLKTFKACMVAAVEDAVEKAKGGKPTEAPSSQ